MRRGIRNRACVEGVLGLTLALGGSVSAAKPPRDTPPDPAAVAEALAAGDAHYGRRAEGASGGAALPFHADGAVVEYRRALALDPRSRDAQVGLMRAIFFRTGFCGPMEERDKVRLLDEAKKVAEQAMKQVDSATRRRKGRDEASPSGEGARDAEPLRAGNRSSEPAAPPPAGAGPPEPEPLRAAEVSLWAAVSWGQWAVHHRLKAAWQGAPKRIRDLAEAVLAIDPDTAQHGAYIILGRLHCEAPRVPGITGWVSCEKGLSFLRQGLAGAPDNQALVYFLADELLRRDGSAREEAQALLRRCAESTPRPEFPVEDAHYAELARRRLAAMR